MDNESNIVGGEEEIILEPEMFGGAPGTTDFNELENRPSYAGEVMTGETNIPAVPTAVSQLTNDSGYQTASEVSDAVGIEATDRQNADNGLQSQIDALAAASDVTDIVGTKAELNAYDTSKLKDNDIIKVLQDESEDDETTYYRWSTTTETFTLIGAEGPYYTKSATDQLLQAKQDKLTAGANINIDEENVISATNTTYSNFTGTDGVDAGTSGLVPAPATTDAGKYLKADGTWDSVPTPPTVVQTEGSSITDVMSQAAVTAMKGKAKVLTTDDYNWPTTGTKTGVALWLLEPGLYYALNGIVIYPTTAGTDSFSHGGTAIVGELGSAMGTIVTFNSYNGAAYMYQINPSTGAKYAADSLTTTVVQTTGTSQTSVMSQNATTGMVYADPANTRQIRIGNNANTIHDYSITIGEDSSEDGTNSIAIGRLSRAGGNGSVAVGGAGSSTATTQATGAYSVALGFRASATSAGSAGIGAFSSATSTGEMNIGSTNTSYGYNSSNYRLLTGLYDGQSAHDAATKGQLDSIAIKNAGAPTTSTVGTVGQLLEDTTNGKLYICTAVTPGTDPEPTTYTWEEVGGSAGPTVVQTTGTSTTDVMSQRAITNMIYANPSQIANGGNAIGYSASISNNNAMRAVAIGPFAAVATDGAYSVALGASSQTSMKGQVDISTIRSAGAGIGYNNSDYRLLTGLYDPQSAHDAATKGYVDARIISGGASAPTTATVGAVGTQYTYVDTTGTPTAHLCVCTEIDTTDPNAPVYTWQQLV